MNLILQEHGIQEVSNAQREAVGQVHIGTHVLR